jgi:hypothetical protein
MTPKSVHVSGYTRKDGTHVRAYNRRPPGSVAHDEPYEMLIQFLSVGIIAGIILAAFSIREIKETHTDKYSKHNHLPPPEIQKFTETNKQEIPPEKMIEYLPPDDLFIRSQIKKERTETSVPELLIEYEDVNRRITKRKIKIISIYEDYNELYIRAYCYLRNEDRTFKFSRIIQLTVDGVICDKRYLLNRFFRD